MTRIGNGVAAAATATGASTVFDHNSAVHACLHLYFCTLVCIFFVFYYFLFIICSIPFCTLYLILTGGDHSRSCAGYAMTMAWWQCGKFPLWLTIMSLSN